MDKPLSQERLSESDIRVIEADLFGVTRIIKDRVFHEMYANSRNMSIKLLSEVKRLQAIEAERDRYKETLKWYADKENHEIMRRIGGDYAPITLDKGDHARKSLKGTDTNETN